MSFPNLFTAAEIEQLRALWEASRETDVCDLCSRPSMVLRLIGPHSFCLSCAPVEARDAN